MPLPIWSGQVVGIINVRHLSHGRSASDRQPFLRHADVSLWQVGFLPFRSYTRTFLGPHVGWELLGALARIQGSQTES